MCDLNDSSLHVAVTDVVEQRADKIRAKAKADYVDALDAAGYADAAEFLRHNDGS